MTDRTRFRVIAAAQIAAAHEFVGEQTREEPDECRLA
jgi:hypothetical protein